VDKVIKMAKLKGETTADIEFLDKKAEVLYSKIKTIKIKLSISL
jgi:hypothetical protein